MVSGVPGTPGPAAQRHVGMVLPHGKGCVTALPLHTEERSARANRYKLKTALNNTAQVSGVVCHKDCETFILSPYVEGNVQGDTQSCANSCTYTTSRSASLYHIQLMVAGETGQSGADVTKSVVEGSSSGCAAAIILLQNMEGSCVLGVLLRRGAATLIPALWTVSGRSGPSGPLALPVVREA